MASMERPKGGSKAKKKSKQRETLDGKPARQAPAPPSVAEKEAEENENVVLHAEPAAAAEVSSDEGEEFVDAVAAPETALPASTHAATEAPAPVLLHNDPAPVTSMVAPVSEADLTLAGQAAARVPAWLDATTLPPVARPAALPSQPAPTLAQLPPDLQYARPPVLASTPPPALLAPAAPTPARVAPVSTSPLAVVVPQTHAPVLTQAPMAPTTVAPVFVAPAMATAAPMFATAAAVPFAPAATMAPPIAPAVAAAAGAVAPAAVASGVGQAQSLKLGVPVTVAAPPALTEGQLEAYYPLPLVAEHPVRTARFLHGAGQAPNHPLYELLLKYVAARAAVTAEQEAGAANKAKMENLQERCWVVSEEKEEFKVRCNDDQPVTIVLSHTIARFHPEIAEELRRCQIADSDRSLNTLVRIRFECQLVRQQIDDFILDTTSACCSAASIAPHRKLEGCLLNDYKGPEHRAAVDSLRAILHVLFAFRRKALTDSTVRFDLSQWLERCLAIALAVGTPECALDLLAHLVRSGNGFGEEFAKYLQFNEMWSDTSIQVTAALLATLVTPAETLMETNGSKSDLLRQESMNRDESWSVVDNDLGEVTTALHNTTLGENDCTLLLNQFPIKAMMQHFYAELSGGAQSSSTDPIAVPSVLKLFAFMNAIFRLLCTGLADPVRTRHLHYTRHLSRLVMQSLNLLTSQWREIAASYLAARLYDPLFHLQAEYDGIVVRMVHRMSLVGKAGALQFLPHVALDALSSAGAWAVLLALFQPSEVPEQNTNVDPWLRWQHATEQPDFRAKFYDLLVNRSDIGVYILATLGHLAQSRHLTGTPLQRLAEWRLIVAIMRELFMLGFCNASTATEHSKTVRDVLSGMVDHHCFLLPEIFDLIHTSTLTIAPSWIVATMPLKRWILTVANARYLGADLQQPIHSKMHLFAREVLSALNYGMVQLREPSGVFQPVFFPVSLPVGVDPAQLEAELPPLIITPREAVSLPLQLELACAMAQAFATLVPLEDGYTLSTLAGQRKETQKYAVWAWETICKFSLHEFPITEVDTSILTDRLRQYSTHPFAQYVRLLIDRPGRDASFFLTEGVRILTTLVQANVVSPVLSALFILLPPHFAVLRQTPSMADFGLLIKYLIMYDARPLSLTALPLPGPSLNPPILARLCEVFVRHIRGHNAHLHVTHEALIQHSERAVQAAELWLRALLQIPDWHTLGPTRDCIECVIRSVADVDGSVTMVTNCFVEVYRAGEAALAQPKQQKWFSFRKTPLFFTLTEEPDEGLIGSVLKMIKQGDGAPPAHPYLIFYSMLYETVRETTTRRSLGGVVYSHPTIKPEDACEKVGCEYNTLTVLRWLKFALSIDFDHPLHPLFWQLFFSLYFASMPLNDLGGGRIIHRCYGRTFVSKPSLIEKIRQRLDRAVNFWRTRAAATPDQQSAKDQLDLFASMLRWISDDIFKRPEIDTALLNETHNIPRFVGMFDAPPLDALPRIEGWLWKDLLVPFHEQAERTHAHTLGQHKWLALHNRESIMSLNINHRPAHKIQEELQKLDLGEAQPSPPLVAPEHFTLLLDVSKVLSNEKETLHALQVDMDLLLMAAQRHQERLAMAYAITEEYVNLLPTLYSNTMRPSAAERRCSDAPSFRGPPCTGAAVVRKDTRQCSMVLDTKGRISSNRQRYNNLIAERAVPDGFVPCVLRLQRLAQGLASAAAAGRLAASAQARVVSLSSQAFFQILSCYTVAIQTYPPAAAAARDALSIFGSNFVASNKDAVMTLLLVLLQRADIVVEFAHYLTPTVAPRLYVACMQTIHRSIQEGSVSATPAHSASPPVPRRMTQGAAAGAATGQGAPAARVQHLMVILNRFDINAWLADSPPLSERQDLMTCFRAVFEHITMPASAAIDESYRPLLAFFRDHFVALLGFRFPELFNHTLSFCVPLSRKRALPADIWVDLVSVITARRSALKGQASMETTSWLRQQWLEQRAAGAMQDQLEAWRPYVPSVAAFCRVLVEGFPLEEAGLPPVFAAVTSLLEPWLVGVPGKMHPIPTAPACIEAAAQLCDVFVGFLQQPAVPKPQAMALFVEYYFKALQPGSPSHVLSLYHRVFASLSYDALPLTPALLHSIRTLLVEDRETYLLQSAVFFATILGKVDWANAVAAIIAAEQQCIAHGVAIDPHSSLSFFVDNALNTVVLLVSVGDPQAVVQLRPAMPRLLQLPFAYLHQQALAAALSPMQKLPSASLFEEDAALPSIVVSLLRAAAQFDAVGQVDLPNVLEKRLAFIRALTHVLARVAVERPAPTVTYFGSLLLDIVKSCQSVHADYSAYTLLLGPAMGLLTASLPARLSDDLRSAIVSVFVSQPPLAMAVLQAACRSISSLKDMVLVAEACIDVRFGALQDLTAANQFGWGEVTAFFEAPDLFLAEFTEAAVAHACWGTLYAHARRIMQQPNPLLVVSELYDQVLSWIKRCQPQSSNPLLEAKLILLFNLQLDILTHLRRNNFEVPVEPRLIALAEICDRLGNDKVGNALIRFLSPASPFSPSFRLYMRTLAAFCSFQVLENNTLRIVAPGLPSPSASKLADKYLKSLLSSKSSKAYADLVEIVDVAHATVVDPSMMLSTHARLATQLLAVLFGDVAHLKLLTQ